jgi:hypothetical protein
MTTLLPIFVHSALIDGLIDSKPTANERELNLRKSRSVFVRFSLKYKLNLATFFVQTAASSLSEQRRQ